MHKYTAWVNKIAERTMMAGLYKAEKLLKAIDDEEATNTEIEALAHAMVVICKSDKLMHHIEETNNGNAHTESDSANNIAEAAKPVALAK